ncbi:trypsin-like peptidase domain-containing protein [Pseudomonas sp. LS-2]|uniref:trypsin-like peptidase domain-containing protein n=1 Tax=Pseudomonas sp. LS-2 TaxID=2315859 RepID=UPI000E73C05D|nr:trypsin-like peptidase domain-containing protein [Pseudomonas sp. LS-2]RJX78948.1 serine protease [Pseudomonas sp. LS-2]
MGTIPKVLILSILLSNTAWAGGLTDWMKIPSGYIAEKLAVLGIGDFHGITAGKNYFEYLDDGFVNEFNPALSKKMSHGDLLKLVYEHSDGKCTSYAENSLTKPDFQKAGVAACFAGSSNSDESGQISFNKIRDSLASLTYKSSHRCIAVYMGEGEWLTARHCISELSGNYVDLRLITPDGNFRVDKVINCVESGCDYVWIRPYGTSYSKSVPARLGVEAISKISASDELFIPGIEEKESIPGGSFAGVQKAMKWTRYTRTCIAIKVRRGCLTHTCSTVQGFSGAPVFAFQDGVAYVVGIHLGVDKENVCNDGGRNFAVSINRIKGSKG